ncbi:hypothetical protein EIN_523500 [Entamoeba invadens IP1]|uniref:Phosphoglycerate mutase family protein n=1 Tax=Entamoeba invadens IP1 TaxID=370355 RepID=A0A0A1UB85_ENTIV|nr:hypothetical protein EIN_523500 [Entamoeba invadens IP1]ELP92462.1 hypothetical protein EIN_523500 [Entamoeba invadens IP1]|eukprot:XP_004259233.1 hypothetical protein EIN_523500 [Entamoeba invadens IP1]
MSVSSQQGVQKSLRELSVSFISTSSTSPSLFSLQIGSPLTNETLNNFIKSPTGDYFFYEMLYEFVDILNANKGLFFTRPFNTLRLKFYCTELTSPSPCVIPEWVTLENVAEGTPKYIFTQDEFETKVIRTEMDELYESFITSLKTLHTTHTSIPRIFLVRHAIRVDYMDLTWVPNAKYEHDPPLHADGVAQSRDVSHRLRHEKFDLIISSPFFRATETARYIAAEQKQPFGIENGVAEFISVRNRVKLPEFDPARCLDEFYDRNYVPVEKEMSLETWEGMAERVTTTLYELSKRYNRICVVTHRSTEQSLFSKILGKLTKQNYAFTSVCTLLPLTQKPYFKLERIDSHHHLNILTQPPAHNPNYALQGVYKDMIRGKDGKILASVEW